MTLAYWCVLIAIVLPYLATASAKFLGAGYGPRANSDPRAFLSGLEGWRKRANNAQLNGFEVTPAFAAAVIIAHQAGGAEQGLLDQLAIAFVLSRVLYFLCYLADWGPIRSLVWFAGVVRRYGADRQPVCGLRLTSAHQRPRSFRHLRQNTTLGRWVVGGDTVARYPPGCWH